MSKQYFSSTYSVLSPLKCLSYTERMKQFKNNDFYNIKPVTAHLVPTLRCNHKCFFCTYGKIKDNKDHINTQNHTMTLEQMYNAIDQLAANDIKGVIFTGGGEPTVYPELIKGMEYCKKQKMDFSINTNGRFSNQDLIEQLIMLNPTYIRVSLNAGSSEVQKVTTGVDDFDAILNNLKKLITFKHKHKTQTDISIGYVVNVLNVFDLKNLYDILIKIEDEMKTNYGIESSIFSMQIRPVSNYENSKHMNKKAFEKASDYLLSKYGESYKDEFEDFMLNGSQCSDRTLTTALDIIEHDILPHAKKHSNITISYPKQKYTDLISKSKKTYDVCLSCPWFLFIWPNGNVYHCVEWAGTEGFEIGNLNEDTLDNILSSQKRQNLLSKINNEVISNRCAPVCAHHEMNIILNDIKNSGKMPSEETAKSTKHLSFL